MTPTNHNTTHMFNVVRSHHDLLLSNWLVLSILVKSRLDVYKTAVVVCTVSLLPYIGTHGIGSFAKGFRFHWENWCHSSRNKYNCHLPHITCRGFCNARIGWGGTSLQGIRRVWYDTTGGGDWHRIQVALSNEGTGLSSKVLTNVAVWRLVVWLGSFVGLKSDIWANFCLRRWTVMTCGKIDIAEKMTLPCTYWSDTPLPIPMLDVYVDPNIDHCVPEYWKTLIVFGSGPNDTLTIDVGVGELVRGRDINTCSELLKQSRICGKNKMLGHGMIWSRLQILFVTPTSTKIGTDPMRFFNLSYGVKYCSVVSFVY